MKPSFLFAKQTIFFARCLLGLKQRLFKTLARDVSPRGTLARIARRVGATLHPSSEACGWRSEKEFRREARRIRRWYRGGRKTMRRSVGLPRTDGSPHYVRGLKTAWTKKVGLHYKRFFGRIRQEVSGPGGRCPGHCDWLTSANNPEPSQWRGSGATTKQRCQLAIESWPKTISIFCQAYCSRAIVSPTQKQTGCHHGWNATP